MKRENESQAYLTFALGAEKFAITVESVQEIVELDQVTKVPNAPEYMLGIINLRGKVLPLLDTRLKLGLPKTEITKKSRIMVLDIEAGDDKNVQIGALVDVAKEVIQLQPEEIQEAPDFENYKTQAPITGLVNNQGDITMIMDIARIFNTSEILHLEQSVI
ncbi:chemotaxis protein CheW [Fulvivirgaceae bacterium PWU4]|uniref:Chemotaxis protein CheW n=1 Tax=Chryseosolibacter histidini TaxID=2782349 RepID=A0AAP2DT03_9BACT|nr:chemotaxis protein CheW [Chryseosolibacter histidini]MBT1700652.1 chemotaxis protein CheW [Chryseosolibacter histidini]